MIALAIFSLLLASISAALFIRNLMLYVPPPVAHFRTAPRVSVLIPARNEEHNIAGVVGSVLASEDMEVEVIIGNDGSEDRTAAIIQEIADRDPRVRLLDIPSFPAGWNGKQHACYSLANSASMPLLCFLDADVRLAPDALVRMAGFLRSSGAALVSGVPREITGSVLESLLIPLIQFVLLGYLPLDGMRRSNARSYAAGCGQLFMASADAYHAVGGHSAIPATLHDGIKLPAAFRRHGFYTDLFDASTIASCRMYHNAREVWSGLAKNATEGMATPLRLPIFTMLLLGGHVLPFVLLTFAVPKNNATLTALSLVAVLLSCIPRALAVLRFGQPVTSAALHPLGITLLLVIQWYALARQMLGRPASWKGRACGAQPSSNIAKGEPAGSVIPGLPQTGSAEVARVARP